MKDFEEKHEDLDTPDFEIDHVTLSRLRQKAMEETRAQANLVDGDIVEERDED